MHLPQGGSGEDTAGPLAVSVGAESASSRTSSPRRKAGTDQHRYAEDLPDDVICDDTFSEEVLRRRYLAVPLPRERAEGAETLDPSDPDGRSRITGLWLGERRIPRDRWASYRTLVDQLWAGDPPEIAEQATRMAADGLDRNVIFGKLIKDTPIRA